MQNISVSLCRLKWTISCQIGQTIYCCGLQASLQYSNLTYAYVLNSVVLNSVVGWHGHQHQHNTASDPPRRSV